MGRRKLQEICFVRESKRKLERGVWYMFRRNLFGVSHCILCGKSGICWLEQGGKPGQYPAGGPIAKMMEVWTYGTTIYELSR